MDWIKYQEIAKRFQHKAKREDREDLRQTIILRLAEVEAKYNGNGKSLTEWGMLRVASYTVLGYWREQYRKPTMLSLNTEIEDGDGDTVELWQTIADDRAIDLEAWLDANIWLYRAPARLVTIAHKKVNGLPLTDGDKMYLSRFRKNGQKRLF